MASNAIDLLYGTVNGSLSHPTAGLTTTANGALILDMGNGTALTNVFADIGVVTGTLPTLAIQIQESSDQTTWTVPPGLNVSNDQNAAGLMTTITVAGFYGITFQRTKRYVRATWTVGGSATPTFPASIVAFDQGKQTGTPTTGISRSPSS